MGHHLGGWISGRQRFSPPRQVLGPIPNPQMGVKRIIPDTTQCHRSEMVPRVVPLPHCHEPSCNGGLRVTTPIPWGGFPLVHRVRKKSSPPKTTTRCSVECRGTPWPARLPGGPSLHPQNRQNSIGVKRGMPCGVIIGQMPLSRARIGMTDAPVPSRDLDGAPTPSSDARHRLCSFPALACGGLGGRAARWAL